MVLSMMGVCWYASRRNGWGSVSPLSMSRILTAARRAYLGFFAMFIVIYGIYSGVFSPTEAAAITVGFCLIAGLLLTREIKWRDLPDILLRSGQLTGMLAPMIAISVVMSRCLVCSVRLKQWLLS